MKLKYILFATSLFAFTAANTAVSAAEEPGAKTGKAEAAKTDTTKKLKQPRSKKS